MDWRIKALCQNFIAMFPEQVSNGLYYRAQRVCGGLRKVNPMEWVNAAVEFSTKLKSVSHDMAGKNIFEIGTGRRINFPLVCWLMGAGKITTVDKNRYLKEELIVEDVNYIRDNREAIEKILDGNLHDNRVDELVRFTDGAWSVPGLLSFCGIEYISPGDATAVPVSSGYFDIHTSYNVLEHIPPAVLEGMFKEGKRILKKDGIFVHRIDYSDHFSHSDKNISSINFLKYGDGRWRLLAGNRYMYMNRLRLDDFRKMFSDLGLHELLCEPTVDANALKLLESQQLRPIEPFRRKPHEVLATSSSWNILKAKFMQLTGVFSLLGIIMSYQASLDS